MLRVKKLTEDAIVPTRGSDGAAGYDLYANETVGILPHQAKKIRTGLSIVPPSGYFCALFARSGLATKQGLRPANCVGVCDEDYRGEYIVVLYNDSDELRTIGKGDRIAQLILLPYLNEEIEVVEDLDDTERGSGGFGSTGI